MPMNVQGSDSLYWSTGFDNSGLKSGSTDAKGIIRNLAASISKEDVFAAIGVSAVAAFGVASRAAYGFAKDLQTSMGEVQTISADVQRNLEGYTNAIVDMSRRLPDTAQGLSRAYYQVVSAGYDGAEGLRVLESASKGAIAGVTDTLTAVDGLTTVLNSFKYEVSESDKVMDILFKTVEKGKTTFPELASKIAIVAPLAAATGVSLEEIMGGLATLTKQGTPTAEAMTQIRASLVSLNEVLGDGWSKTMTFQEAMQAVYDKAGGSQNELRDLLGRVEALNAVLALSGQNFEGAAADLDAIRDSAGAAGAAYETMASKAENQFKLLHNTTLAKLKPLGDALLGMATDVSGGLLTLLNDTDSFLERMIRSHEEFIAVLGKEKHHLQSLVDQLDELKKGTEEYTQVEAQLIAYLGDDMTMALSDATEKMDAYAVAKQRIIDLDKEILLSRRELVLAEIEMNRIEQEKLRLGEAKIEKEIDYLRQRRENRIKDARQTAKELAQSDKTYADQTLDGGLTARQQEIRIKLARPGGIERLEREYFNKQMERINQLASVRQEELRLKELEQEKIVRWQTLILNGKQLQESLNGYTNALEHYGDAVKETADTEKPSGMKRFGLVTGGDYRPEGDAAFEMEKQLIQQKIDLYEYSIDRRRDLERGLFMVVRDLQDDELRNFIANAKEQLKYIKENSELRTLWLKKIQDAEDEMARRQRENLQDMSDAIREMGDFMALFDEDLSRTAYAVSGLVRSLGDLTAATNPFEQIGAGVSAVGSVIGIMDSIFGGGRSNAGQKYIDQMETLNAQTQKQLDLLRRMNGQEALGGLIDLYARLNDEIVGNIESLKNLMVVTRQGKNNRYTTLGEWASTNGRSMLDLTAEEIKSLFNSQSTRDAYEALVDDINKAKEALLDYQDEYKEIVTGTTAESIADSIAEGFSQGLDDAEIFADTFEKLMRNAMTEAFKRQLITEHLNYFYDEFYSSLASGGELTAEEIAQLAASLQRDITLATSTWEDMKKIMQEAGLDLVDAVDEEAKNKSGLSGAIQGITAQQADMLEGQFNAVRIDIKSVLELMRSESLVLTTSGERLRVIQDRMKSIDNSAYYLDDIFARSDMSLNALRDIRDASYNISGVMFDRLDDLVETNRRIANNTELLKTVVKLLGTAPAQKQAYYNPAITPDDEITMNRAMGV